MPQNTPLIDAVVNREPAIPRGPLRSELASADFIAEMAGWTGATMSKELIKRFIAKGGL